jgi:hypothetical protein
MAIKPGTPHPNKKGMVMGKNGRYVAKSTYAKQVKAAKSAAKPAAKPAAPKAQKALPPAGQTAAGKARRYPTASGSARQAIARGKQVTAAQGTTSSKVRVGQPAGSANRMYGANVVGKAVGRAQRAAAVSKAGKVAGRAAVPLGMAAEVKEMSDRAKRDAERNKKLGRRPFEELRADSRKGNPGRRGQGGQGSSSRPRPQATPTNKSTSRGGQGNRGRNSKPATPQPATTASKPKPKPTTTTASKPKPTSRKNVTPTAAPKVKPQAKKPAGKKPAKPQTSGVGPVASGRTYSVQKTGKSVMQQQADELRAMRKRSQERQEADKKKKRKYGR